MALPRKHRVVRKKDFAVLFHSRPVSTEHFQLRVVRSLDGVKKMTVRISTATAPRATTRNHLRRIVSEVLRKTLPQTVSGYIAVVTITRAALPTGQVLHKELMSLLKKSGILSQ